MAADPAVGTDLVALVGSHRAGMVPVQGAQESLAQAEDTSQQVRHKAYPEYHQVLEDHHDPIQPAEEGRKVGIGDVEQREVRLEEVGLAVGDLAERQEDPVGCAAGLGFES